QEEIVTDAINILSNYKSYACSPDLAMAMHGMVKAKTQTADPYRKIKDADIQAALKLYPQLKDFLKQKNNSLYWALKIAATGNNIDSAIYQNIDINRCVDQELKKDFGKCDLPLLQERLKTAHTILIIGDNAGETVFDKLLVQTLLPINIIYAARNEPILNDATVQDARDSGLDECASIISTGCNAPGAILKQCSDEFLTAFREADIVISKGQGNYEALSDCEREVFFLLKAKCPMIAERLGVDLNEYAFVRHTDKKQTERS
ncbi:MAG TPA: ARMT1-like domain-containing protein, partial [Clostridia bacterium]|nr:ARMT1-like domain-containing protein [Clostridia bacterium]